MKNPRLLALLLAICAVTAFIPAIRAGYIWDDDTLLTENPLVSDPHGLVQIWQGKNSRDYTPLTITAFWLEWRLWGDAPLGYHIVNLLLHALAALLLWRILEALRIPGAWLGALLFAIHPVNAASAAWIAELKNTLSSVFFLASILTYLRAFSVVLELPGAFAATCRGDCPQSSAASTTACASQKPPFAKTSLYILSIILFLLAGLAKGAVVTLPGILFLCILWKTGKFTWRDILRLIPFAGIALLIAGLTIHYQAIAVHYGLIPETIPYRIARAGMSVWWYLEGIFFPIGLSPFAPQWQFDLHSPLVYLPAFAVAALLVFFFIRRKSWGRPFLFAYSCYLWMLLPILGFVWMALQQEAPATDWWQYMAAPAIFAGVGSGAAITLRRTAKNTRLLLQTSLVAIVALLFIQSWRRSAIYQSMETYCTAVVAETPHVWTMQNNLGVVLKRKGDFAGAIAHYRQSLADNPKFTEARANLGNALSASGNYAEAETAFQEALKLRPGNPELLSSLASALWGGDKLHEALAAQAAAIQADRNNPQYYSQFGLMLAANKQFPQAVTCFKNALVLDPGNVTTQINLIRGLLITDRRAEAAALCREALQTAQKSRDEKQIEVIDQLLKEALQPAGAP